LTVLAVNFRFDAGLVVRFASSSHRMRLVAGNSLVAEVNI
jgi:hypothetical protein